MKLVHISDLHLGYKQYQRQTASGLNQREADIARTFRKAIDKIIEIRPDVILVAGDVFHAVRPTNPAILHAWIEFSRLRAMLPDANIVMIAGNHDSPRTRETGSILRLFGSLDIQVVEGDSRSVRFPERKLNVLAVPEGSRGLARFEPDPTSEYNVLLIHDEVEGLMSRFGSLAERAGGTLTMKEMRPDRWNYVALGHYHVYRQVAPNAYYSGSIDYASTSIWAEVDEQKDRRVPGKGFIEHDLATGAHEFHAITGLRDVVDLPEIDAKDLTAAELSEKISETVETHEGGIDDKIVRLIVRDVPRHILRDLDHRKIREFKRRAMNFLLDARKPAPLRIENASGAPGRRASLTETVRVMLETRPVTPGIDRKSLVDLGLRYLDEAERLAPAITGDEP
jgi:DNA repair protein SbcD/Mre11